MHCLLFLTIFSYFPQVQKDKEIKKEIKKRKRSRGWFTIVFIYWLLYRFFFLTFQHHNNLMAPKQEKKGKGSKKAKGPAARQVTIHLSKRVHKMFVSPPFFPSISPFGEILLVPGNLALVRYPNSLEETAMIYRISPVIKKTYRL